MTCSRRLSIGPTTFDLDKFATAEATDVDVRNTFFAFGPCWGDVPHYQLSFLFCLHFQKKSRAFKAVNRQNIAENIAHKFLQGKKKTTKGENEPPHVSVNVQCLYHQMHCYYSLALPPFCSLEQMINQSEGTNEAPQHATTTVSASAETPV